MSAFESFTKWVDGEKPVPLHTEFKPPKAAKEKKKPAALDDKKRLDGFLKLYARCAVVISALMLIVPAVLSAVKDEMPVIMFFRTPHLME